MVEGNLQALDEFLAILVFDAACELDEAEVLRVFDVTPVKQAVGFARQGFLEEVRGSDNAVDPEFGKPLQGLQA